MTCVAGLLLLGLFEFAAPTVLCADPIPNERIDQQKFLRDVQEAHRLRQDRRVSEADFIRMAGEKETIILDARSANRFQEMHIAGAKNLPLTDFTTSALAAIIPSPTTRILIYCNNNVKNQERAFPSKIAPASLNLSTFPTLFSYGYRNVFELGPEIDPAHSTIRFDGTLAQRN